MINRHQETTIRTTIPSQNVGEFIGRRGENIIKLQNKTGLGIDVDDASSALGEVEVFITGFPANTQKVANDIRYKFRDILPDDIIRACILEADNINNKILVKLPNGKIGEINNLAEITQQKVRETVFEDGVIEKVTDIQVISTPENQAKSIKASFQDQKPNSILANALKETMAEQHKQTTEKQDIDKNHYLVDVLPHLKEKANISQEMIGRFIGKKGSNIRYLQDKLNVILECNETEVTILGSSEDLVNWAKREIEEFYTAFEATVKDSWSTWKATTIKTELIDGSTVSVVLKKKIDIKKGQTVKIFKNPHFGDYSLLT